MSYHTHIHSSLLIHVIFSTKDRIAFLDDRQIVSRLIHYMKAITKDLQSPLIRANAFKDHIHLLVSLSPKVSVSNWVKEMKRMSSIWIKKQDASLSKFSWQPGSASFSVSYSNRQKVVEYIDNQQIHHQNKDFIVELNHLFRLHQMALDDNCVTDTIEVHE